VRAEVAGHQRCRGWWCQRKTPLRDRLGCASLIRRSSARGMQ